MTLCLEDISCVSDIIERFKVSPDDPISIDDRQRLSDLISKCDQSVEDIKIAMEIVHLLADMTESFKIPSDLTERIINLRNHYDLINSPDYFTTKKGARKLLMQLGGSEDYAEKKLIELGYGALDHSKDLHCFFNIRRGRPMMKEANVPKIYDQPGKLIFTFSEKVPTAYRGEEYENTLIFVEPHTCRIHRKVIEKFQTHFSNECRNIKGGQFFVLFPTKHYDMFLSDNIAAGIVSKLELEDDIAQVKDLYIKFINECLEGKPSNITTPKL